jgi:hypothetical protein
LRRLLRSYPVVASVRARAESYLELPLRRLLRSYPVVAADAEACHHTQCS